MVEVMALSHASDADVMVAALKRRGYEVAVSHTPQDSLLHLDVGPFTNKQDAESMRQRLVRDGYNATMK
jgi:DedD protein